MIRFVHTADIHFGVENYGKIDPQTGIHSRLLDFAKALNFCIDIALEKEVDFFLFCGDAYKTHHPSQTQQKMLLESLLRLYSANIPVIIVVGNHDNPLSFGKAHALDLFGQLPLTGFQVIAKPTLLTLPTKNGPVQIVGIPWPTRNTIALEKKHEHKNAHEITEYISQAVAAIITHYAQQLDPHIPAVLASHMTVSSGIFSGSEKRAIYGTDPVLLPSQLAIAPFDYVALGHLHRYQNLNPHGYPAIVYSGSIERVDFGERKEEKGFCLVSIEEKNKTTHQFIPTPMRPFIQIECTLQPGLDQTKQLVEAIEKHTLKDAIVKIIYYLPPDTKDSVNLIAVERACQEALQVVKIVPIAAASTRTARTGALKIDMELPELLESYFALRPALKDRKDDLIQKTLGLLDESQEEHEC